MYKLHEKIIAILLIFNITALCLALAFVTSKKISKNVITVGKKSPYQAKVVDKKVVKNYTISQWSLSGALDDNDLVYDFKNGIGGKLNKSVQESLLEGESVWFYSKKLQDILTEENNKIKKYAPDDDRVKGYVAIINRTNKSRVSNPKLSRWFPVTIEDYSFNLATPVEIDLFKHPEANNIFYESRQKIQKLFNSF